MAEKYKTIVSSTHPPHINAYSLATMLRDRQNRHHYIKYQARLYVTDKIYINTFGSSTPPPGCTRRGAHPDAAISERDVIVREGVGLGKIRSVRYFWNS